MGQSLLRTLASLFVTLICMGSAPVGKAAHYTVVPTLVTLNTGRVTGSLSVEPVSDVRGAWYDEDTLNFQVALDSANYSFLLIEGGVQLPAIGVGYGDAPGLDSGLVPSNYFGIQGPLYIGHWEFAGFNPAPFETAILILTYTGGSIAALPPASRTLQLSLLFLDGTRVSLPPIALVSVPEPAALLFAAASAAVFAMRRGRGK